MTKTTIWLRAESRTTERRTPLLPEGAQALIQDGYKVIVEKSKKRIIPNEAYKNVGCEMVESGQWTTAPKDAIILGLKELPATPSQLTNTHIYFAHAYKQQTGWQDLITRFLDGGGDLLDIEYMVTEVGRRVVAFGYFAGYMGAALALIHWHNLQTETSPYLDKGLTPFDNAALLHDTIHSAKSPQKAPKVLIIGAHGRCGKGAIEIMERHGAEVTCWGRAQTENIDRAALLDHDILINCAFILGDVPAFLRQEDLAEGTRLSVVADVSCDPFSAYNPIPLYHDTTTWEKPYITAANQKGTKEIDVIAIDNLPSLLPREASEEFAALLLPHLKTLKSRDQDPIWCAAEKSFTKTVAALSSSVPNQKVQ